MSKKILVVRFNAIGDIVLTSAVVRALALAGHELHYLCKKALVSLVENNPHIKKSWGFDNNWTTLVELLKAEKYDVILDLHNNIRSLKLRKALGLSALVFKKNRVNDVLITRFKFARKQRQHIVNRFMDTASTLIEDSFDIKTEFYFPKGKSYDDLELPDGNYICIAVSTAHHTKNIPSPSLKALIKNLDSNIILLGGPGDREIAKAIHHGGPNSKIIDYAGKLSIDESAYVISKSKLLLTGDTGLMHIAAALGVSVAVVFGSTHPILGYTPFYGSNHIKHAFIQNDELTCRPCTRQGRESCPKGHFKCMKGISVDKIVSAVDAILKA